MRRGIQYLLTRQKNNPSKTVFGSAYSYRQQHHCTTPCICISNFTNYTTTTTATTTTTTTTTRKYSNMSVSEMSRGLGGRIEESFAAAKESGTAAFVSFVTAGYPSPEGEYRIHYH